MLHCKQTHHAQNVYFISRELFHSTTVIIVFMESHL
jgi:hypothetical protein